MRPGRRSKKEWKRELVRRRAAQKRAKRTGEIIRVYGERNRVLRDMGFPTYADYLKSALWSQIRSAVLGNGRPCVRCSQPANQVHHADYAPKTLDGSDISALHPVCRICHELGELDQNGNKKTLNDANSLLLQRLNIDNKKLNKMVAKKRGANVAKSLDAQARKYALRKADEAYRSASLGSIRRNQPAQPLPRQVESTAGQQGNAIAR